MATTEKELGKHEIGINLPSFVLCMAPTMKKEVLEKYNISNEFFMMLDGTFDHLSENDTYMVSNRLKSSHNFSNSFNFCQTSVMSDQ